MKIMKHDDEENVCIYLFIINIIIMFDDYLTGAGVFGAINFMDSRGKIDDDHHHHH
jgi:hypothetical protein